MSVILNIMFTVVAVFFFGGRLYEIIALTDTSTGFIVGKAIVTSPMMMGIICIMAVCCGVIMFSGEYSSKKMKKMPVGVFGYVSGFFFIVGGIVNSVNCFRFGGFIGYHIMEILGGIGLILLGISHVRGKKNERLPMIFILILSAGVCLNSVLYEIKTIRDTDYMMRTLAGITTLMFFTMLFRNAVMQSKITKMLLYITAQMSFAFAGVGSMAAVIGNLVNGTSTFPQMMYNLGFVVLGVYSLFVALLISPAVLAEEKEDYKEQPVRTYKPKRPPQPEYTEPAMNGDSFRQMPTGAIDKAAIEMLFARKEEREKQQDNDYRTVKNAQQEAFTQQVHPSRQVRPEYTEERTAVISRTDRGQKAVYKSDGKKKTNAKVVYKAPK